MIGKIKYYKGLKSVETMYWRTYIKKNRLSKNATNSMIQLARSVQVNLGEIQRSEHAQDKYSHSRAIISQGLGTHKTFRIDIVPPELMLLGRVLVKITNCTMPPA